MIESIWARRIIRRTPVFSKKVGISVLLVARLFGFPEIVGPIYDEINKMYGTDNQPPFKQ